MHFCAAVDSSVSIRPLSVIISEQKEWQMSEPTVVDIGQRTENLLSGIAWQDQLLQSYRNYMVVTQSIFVASDVGLLISQTSKALLADKLFLFVPFAAIVILGVATLTYLGSAILERAKSVDWWQRKLLIAESEMRGPRDFTTFRAAKELAFRLPEMKVDALNEEDLRTLLRSETPKARKVFGVFVPGFMAVWFILFCAAGADLSKVVW